MTHVPVGFCPTCQEDVPVSVGTYEGKDFVWCPICLEPLNIGEDFKVKYYIKPEGLERLGWKKMTPFKKFLFKLPLINKLL